MKKKQKAEPESRRKSSYQGSSRNNSKSGGLTFSEKKRLIQLKHILSGKSNEKEKPTTAQKTITFEKMFRDGICQVSHRYYTKMVEFFDINYSLLEVDEQADILAQYSKLINYFDPSVKFELVLFNRQVNEQMLTEQFDIPWQEDDFNDIREEYTEMLKKQAAKGNNGIIKSKYLIFGVESNGYKEAKSRLNNIEKDVIRNLNNIGTLARGLDGKERLRILHEYFNQDTMEPFRFSFKDLAESGKSVNILCATSLVVKSDHLIDRFLCILEMLLFQSAEYRLCVFCNLFNGKHIYTFYEKPFFKSTKIDKKINDITLL